MDCLTISIPDADSGLSSLGSTTPDVDSGLSSLGSSSDGLDWGPLETAVEAILEGPPPDDCLDAFLSIWVPPQPFLALEPAQVLISAMGPATEGVLGQLVITITGPTGRSLLVDHLAATPDGASCDFRPLIPGPHVIEVSREGRPIPGCPLTLFFSRSYTPALPSVLSFELGVCPILPSTQKPLAALRRKPWGIACNTRNEQIWVADRQHHQILVHNPDGTEAFRVGREGTGPGEFFRPTAIAYDAAHDRMLVTDKDNHRVMAFDANGSFLMQFGTPGSAPGKLAYPWGIAVSPDGSLIAVADTRNHRIQFFNAEGQLVRYFRVGGRVDRKMWRPIFDYPRGLAFNLTGDAVYVTDFNLHTVFQLNLARNQFFPLVPPGLLCRPSGIAVDPSGHLVSRISHLGLHPLDAPTDVALMKAGALAVLDRNCRITVV